MSLFLDRIAVWINTHDHDIALGFASLGFFAMLLIPLCL